MTLVHLLRHTFAGLRVLLALTLLLGVIYPLAVFGVGQVAFKWRADGSLVTSTGAHTTTPADAIGSQLLAQDFAGKQWFHPRPSMAGDGYDSQASAGSNLGPMNPELVKTIEKRKAAIAAAEGVSPAEVPADAVTASSSGLDPDISPAYARLQVARVARENGLAEDVVRRLVERHTSGRVAGVLGDPRVNVLTLNLALGRAR